MRRFVQLSVMVMCLAMVGAGLFLSIGSIGEELLLDRPGAPGRLESSNSSATAFFELDGDALELTMLFTEPKNDDSVFKARVRLAEGQSHSIVVGADEEAGTGAERYTFRRIGYTVEMNRAPATALAAAFTLGK